MSKFFIEEGSHKRTSLTLFGWPLIDIAMGPNRDKGEKRAHARGIIAISSDVATGIIAQGTVARGVVALGAAAFGVVAIGGLSMGVICVGGVAIGLFGFGGLAIGILAAGGVAIGYGALGGVAFGFYAGGGAAHGKYIVSAMQKDPQAIAFFNKWMFFLPIT